MKFLKILFPAFVVMFLLIACSTTIESTSVPVAATGSSTPQADTAPLELSGLCDASAAVSLASDTFVVAGDEDNLLRIYQPTASQEPLSTFDLSPFLAVTTENSEADIEGATRFGDTIYWITSHGTNKNGKSRPNRHRLFATEVKMANGQWTVTPIGEPYVHLVNDLASFPELKIYALDRAATRDPKEKDALNIEGLAATPDGALLIAFRNPIPEGKALIVPLENPLDVVQGKAPAQFGRPILLDLNGLGIRSIEYSEAQRQYFIIAGPYGEDGDFKFYRWSGDPQDAPLALDDVQFAGLHPEALVIYEEKPGEIQVLSDDGSRQLQGAECKSLSLGQQKFRSLWVVP